MSKKPVIAVSGCLLGEEIRYNGQHKRHIHLAQELSKVFHYETFCPEVSMGLGIPRDPIHLVLEKGAEKPRLTDTKDSSVDYTKLAEKTFKKLIVKYKDVNGFVFTKASPTCGYDPIKTYSPKKNPTLEKRRGLWAQTVEETYPLVPKIDSGRLFDDNLRLNFIAQVKIYHLWKTQINKPKDLIDFHSQHKFYLLQYGPVALKKLGQICAGVDPKNFSDKKQEYANMMFTEVFKKHITDKARNNVLEHMAGFYKEDLSDSDRAYLHDNIKRFHKNKLAFDAVINLMEFLAKSYKIAYIKQQKIFEYYKH
jgi:uncharacterized protein YbbK (DUF523 family)/uncharacterized protein YbgA (DUF1722 family)